MEAVGREKTLWLAAFAAALSAVGTLALIEGSESFARDRKAYLLQRLCQHHWKKLRDLDATARVNIMLRGHRYGRPVLRVLDPFALGAAGKDRKLRLANHAGVAGVAFDTQGYAVGIRVRETVDGKEIPKSYVITKDSIREDMDLGLTPDQRDATKNLNFIASFPIRALSRDGGAQAGKVVPLGDVIGVINIDSETLEPYFGRNDACELEKTEVLKWVLEEMFPDVAHATGYIFG